MQTFLEADLTKDGRISYEEWRQLVHFNPAVISFMTLKPLESVTLMYAGFLWNKDRRY